ncbi:MAG: DUF819 family protein, partial [candidate division Zixibacteria bacterium]|nr:DUF819 family protein [candidate division Zixibacteria bacterium]
MDLAIITSPAGVLATLAAVTSFFFFLEKRTEWKFFNYFPPLIFIYLIPVALSNSGVIPTKSPLYDFMGSNILPMFLLIMLLDVDILATVRVMGRGVFVMLLGTLGVVVGAPVAFLLVKHGLGPDAWKAFATLAGSWIGGTGNMAAVAIAYDLDESTLDFGYAVIADNAVYLIWLPIMLASKNFAGWFNRFTGISKTRLERMEKAAAELTVDKGKVEMRHYLYLAFFGFGVTAMASWLSGMLPPLPADEPVISANTYKILIVTFTGVALSFTRASRIPGSHALAMA